MQADKTFFGCRLTCAPFRLKPGLCSRAGCRAQQARMAAREAKHMAAGAQDLDTNILDEDAAAGPGQVLQGSQF